MRVLLSLVNRSSDQSNNSDNNSEHCDNSGEVIDNKDYSELPTSEHSEDYHERGHFDSANTLVPDSLKDPGDLSVQIDSGNALEQEKVDSCETLHFETISNRSVEPVSSQPQLDSRVAFLQRLTSPPRTLKYSSSSHNRSLSQNVAVDKLFLSSPSRSTSASCLHSDNLVTNISVHNEKPASTREASTATLVAASHQKLKRPRQNSKSEAISRRKMAVGGRAKNDSDDDATFAIDLHQSPPRRFWVEPAENEAPIISHSNTSTTLELSPTDDEVCHLSQPSVTDVGSATAAAPSNESEKLAYARFINALKKRGLEMIEQEGDGNCLFRAVSLQVYGSPDNHSEVRERCMDYMAKNEEHFSNFIAASSDDELPVSLANGSTIAFQAYIARKRIKGVHGNHTEIQAISELFNRPVEVYTSEMCHGEIEDLEPINIFHEEYKTSDPPIRLSYHDGNHYNAIVDPLIPTAGLGLGMPDLKVGLADKLQVTKAITESDQLADELELQRVLKESQEEMKNQTDNELQKVLNDSCEDYMYEKKMAALSDLDQTNFALEQKVLASSMETYFRQEHGRKQRATVSSVGSSSRRRRCSPSPPEEAQSQSCNAPGVAPSSVARPPASVPSPQHDIDNTTSDVTFEQNAVLDEEYPQVVQELVMNGFELQDVIRAYEFVGDRFDDLLSFLLSSNK